MRDLSNPQDLFRFCVDTNDLFAETSRKTEVQNPVISTKNRSRQNAYSCSSWIGFASAKGLLSIDFYPNDKDAGEGDVRLLNESAYLPGIVSRGKTPRLLQVRSSRVLRRVHAVLHGS